MVSEVFGFTPREIGDMTLSQFNDYRSYAYRARVENLLGHYSFADKHKPWKIPGISNQQKPVDELSAIVQSIKRRTGKSVLTAGDLKGIG